jgi:hypothetical protein
MAMTQRAQMDNMDEKICRLHNHMEELVLSNPVTSRLFSAKKNHQDPY